MVELSAMPLNIFEGKVVGRQKIEAYLARECNARSATIETPVT